MLDITQLDYSPSRQAASVEGMMLIGDLPALPMPRLGFAGGAPLLRADLLEFVAYTIELGGPSSRWKQAGGGSLQVRGEEFPGDPGMPDPAGYLTDKEICKELIEQVEAMEDDVLLAEQAA